MAELLLPEPLLNRLQTIAQQEQRPLEAVVESLLETYNREQSRAQSIETVLYQDRLRLYAIARRYWQCMADSREMLTDAELEAQFWRFDGEGIPRLKADQSENESGDAPNTDGLLLMAQHAEHLHLSANSDDSDYRAILNHDFPTYLAQRMGLDRDQSNSD